MAISASHDKNKVVTGKVRLSFPNLFAAKAMEEGKPAKYSCQILIPKDDTETIEAIKAAGAYAAKDQAHKFKRGKVPAHYLTTLRDGDDDPKVDPEERPELAGHMFMNVNNTRRPNVVDRRRQPIADESEIYAGCYVRVQLSAYVYNVDTNQGVTFGLDNVQKLSDGEPLSGGGMKAADAFDELEDDEDDMEDIDDDLI